LHPLSLFLARHSPLHPHPQSSQLEEAGCVLSLDSTDAQITVDDSRKLRRHLEQKLTLNEPLRRTFLDTFEHKISSTSALRAALRPVVISAGRINTGDSFIRILLNTIPIQADVAALLLERLPEFNEAAAGDNGEAGIPHLILGQFRWLDTIANGAALTSKLLQVLPVCPPVLQGDIISFLPEIATENDHSAIVQELSQLADSNHEIVPAVLNALSGLLSMNEESAVHGLGGGGEGEEGGSLAQPALHLALDRFQAVKTTDLPSLVQFLLQYCWQGNYKMVLNSLRTSLHFISGGTDPRLAAPDRKGKSAVTTGSDTDPERMIIEAMRQAMQLSPISLDLIIREIKELTAPDLHCTLDAWMLAIAHGFGAEWKKTVESMVKKKFMDGQVGEEWLNTAVKGHWSALVTVFPNLLALGQHLIQALQPAARQAGMQLYTLLFSEFKAPFYRQEVLRSLHAHLGAHGAEEATSALQVLVTLARHQTEQLLQYASYLTSILDYLEAYTDVQIAVVFELFGELTAGACRQADINSNNRSGGGSSRTRMEDELFIFLRKQLSSPVPGHLRIGIIGIIALVQRLGEEASSLPELDDDDNGGDVIGGNGGGSQREGGGGEISAVAQRYTEVLGMMDQALNMSRQLSPAAFTFLCDELDHSVRNGRVAKRLLKDLDAKLWPLFEDLFVVQLPPQETGGGDFLGSKSELWFALEQASRCPNAIAIFSNSTTGADSTTSTNNIKAALSPSLSFLPSLFRLVSSISSTLNGSFKHLRAMLVCPISLFNPSHCQPTEFCQLKTTQEQENVLLGLFFLSNWLREVINVFSSQLTTANQKSNLGCFKGQMDVKLMARARQLSQVEATLQELLQYAPPGFQLPCIGAGASSLQHPKLSCVQKRARKTKKGTSKTAAAAAGRGRKRKADDDDDEDQDGSDNGGGDDTTTTNNNNNNNNSSGMDVLNDTNPISAAASNIYNNDNNNNAHQAAGPLSATMTGMVGYRSLLLPALRVLKTGTIKQEGRQQCFAMLPVAAFILEDLSSKLETALAKPKKPNPFNNSKSTGNSTNTNKYGTGGRGGGVPVSDDSPRLLNPAPLLSEVEDTLPAMKHHLEVALDVLMEDYGQDEMMEADEKEFWKPLAEDAQSLSSGGGGLASQYHAVGCNGSGGGTGTGFALSACQKSRLDTEPAMHAMSGRAAARRVFSAVYDCLRQLVQYNSNTDASKSVVLTILNIFPNSRSSRNSNSNRDNGAMERLDLDNASATDVIKRCRACCRKFSKILPIDQDGNPSSQHTTVGSFLQLDEAYTILLLLEGLYRVAKAAQQQAQSSDDPLSAGDIQNLGKIQTTLHKFAESMLKIDWSPPGSDYKAQQGWKGQYTIMLEVLRIMLSNAREPIAVAQQLAATVLPNVTGQGGASTRTALESQPPYLSLSGATIHVWYKAIMTCLLQVWEHEVIASLVTINKSSGDDALSVDDEAKEMLKSRMMTCGEVFKIMMTLVKHQENKVAIHIQAVVGCGKFIEQFLKVLPLWTNMFGKKKKKKNTANDNSSNNNNMEEFISLVKSVQKGGRIAQILCAEGKTKQSMPLTAKVPQVKRTIERFMFHLKAFFTEVGGVDQFTVGALKHKNLMGHEVPSQMFPDYEEEEGDGDGEEEEGDV